MSFDAPVFPSIDADEIVEIIDNTRRLASYLDPVSNTLEAARHMLGDYGAVMNALDVWSTHAVGRIVSSRTFVEDTQPSLDAHWTGPAHRAYNRYCGQTLERMAEVEEKMGEVTGALDAMSGRIMEQYRAAIGAVSRTATALLGMVGDSNRKRVPGEMLEAAGEVLSTLVEEVAKHVEEVVKSFETHQKAVGDAQSAVATLRIPSPVGDVAEVIGEPDQWQPA